MWIIRNSNETFNNLSLGFILSYFSIDSQSLIYALESFRGSKMVNGSKKTIERLLGWLVGVRDDIKYLM